MTEDYETSLRTQDQATIVSSKCANDSFCLWQYSRPGLLMEELNLSQNQRVEKPSERKRKAVVYGRRVVACRGSIKEGISLCHRQKGGIQRISVGMLLQKCRKLYS